METYTVNMQHALGRIQGAIARYLKSLSEPPKFDSEPARILNRSGVPIARADKCAVHLLVASWAVRGPGQAPRNGAHALAQIRLGGATNERLRSLRDSTPILAKSIDDMPADVKVNGLAASDWLMDKLEELVDPALDAFTRDLRKLGRAGGITLNQFRAALRIEQPTN